MYLPIRALGADQEQEAPGGATVAAATVAFVRRGQGRAGHAPAEGVYLGPTGLSAAARCGRHGHSLDANDATSRLIPSGSGIDAFQLRTSLARVGSPMNAETS